MTIVRKGTPVTKWTTREFLTEQKETGRSMVTRIFIPPIRETYNAENRIKTVIGSMKLHES